MADSTLNVTALLPPLGVDPGSGEAVRSTTAASSTAFQTALAAAQSESANPTADSTNPANTDPRPGGLLTLVTQLQFWTPPANAAIAQANSLIPAAVPAEPPPLAEATLRSPADQALLNRPGGPVALLRAVPPAMVAPFVSPATDEAAPASATVPTRGEELSEIPTPPASPGEVATRAAIRVAVRGGLANIPPPAPVVANLFPEGALPADLSAREPVVNELAPIAAVSPLPATDLGDRPALAGEKFVAAASAGALLVAHSAEPPSGLFANELDSLTVAAAVARGPAASVAPPTAGGERSANPATAGSFPAGWGGSGTALFPGTTDFAIGNEFPTVQEGTVFNPRSVTLNPTVGAASDRLPDDNTPALATAAPAKDMSLMPSRPAGPTSASPSTLPAVSRPVADAIVAQARVLERPGAVEFQLRLDPPELGRLHIRLVASGDDLRAQVLVPDEAVRRLLESQLPELRQRLEAAGVSVQELNIATDSAGGRNRPDTPDEPPGFATFPPRSELPSNPVRVRFSRSDASTVDIMV